MAINRTRINALMKQLEKPVRDAFAFAVKKARTRAQIDLLVKAIETGNIDLIMTTAGLRDGMWTGISEGVRNAYVQNGAFVLATDLPKKFAIEFDITNPRAESWLRTRSSQMISGRLIPEQRNAIQVALQNGMVTGRNPRNIALDIVGRISTAGTRSGGVIGLSGPQAEYAVNMSEVLKDNPRNYFVKDRVTGKMKPRYKLADRRFEGTILNYIESGKAIPEKVRMKIVARYSDRMLKHRGDTIARTEVLRAANEASDEAMRQVIDEGLAPPNSVSKVWRHSFSANEREGHLMMDGDEVGMDDFFTNPLTGETLRYPGDGPPSESVNCHCFVEHKIDFVAVEKAA